MRNSGTYLFLVPILLLIAITVGFPIVFNIQVSLTDTRLLTPGIIGHWVGLDNYWYLFTNDDFYRSLWITFIFTVSTVIASFVLGFAVALLMNAIGNRRRWMMVVLLIPWVVSPVVAAYVWRFLFNDDFGMVNELLVRTGLIQERISWLATPGTTIFTIVVCGTWRMLPYMVIMLVAGLQSISKELYEAADVDGAGTFDKLIFITIPQLRYIIAVVVMFALIWTVNDFTIPFVMTADGGSASTRTLPILAYRTAFDFTRFGRASAMSTVILVTLGILSAIYVSILLSDQTEKGRQGLLSRVRNRLGALVRPVAGTRTVENDNAA